jgi:hypothetical protein
MKLGWKDAVATLLFGAIVVPYAFYLALGGITFIQDSNGGTAFGILDPTGMAGLALVLGGIAAIVGGWIVLGEGTVVRYVTGVLGVVGAVLGVLALVGENIFGTASVWFTNASLWETVLGGFIASIALLWGVAITRHAGLVGSGQTHAHSMTPA